MKKRIFLSPPCFGAEERAAVSAAFDSGYVAPCGPMVDELERRLAELSGRQFAVAVSSGTEALNLAMEHLGVDGSWTVVAPSLTFIASVAPAFHRGAEIVFVDSAPDGNIDVRLLDETLADVAGRGRKTLFVSVDLYGRCCGQDALAAICEKRGAVWISDSAEAVGATDRGRSAGSGALAAVYSFNGNKIVTTSGGGALATDSEEMAAHVRKLSQQSREPVVWYEHKEAGYNCRMSNILASIGLAQLAKLPRFIEARRVLREKYAALFAGSGVALLPPVEGENFWMTVALAGSEKERDAMAAALAADGIESRPVWKPMHLQPVFRGCRCAGGSVSEDLFRRGICLPSGSGLTPEEWERISRALAPFQSHAV